MAYIYKITNDINEKVYIGKTIYDIATRLKQHQYDCNKRCGEIRPLYRAMRKYGFEHFHIEQLEECSDVDASDREQYWIRYYNSYIGFPDSNGYNATMGGDGSFRVDRNWIIALWNEGKGRFQIHKITNYDMDTVTSVLKNIGIPDSELKQRHFRDACLSQSKKVAKIDLETGEILHIYNTVADAKRSVGGSKHVSQVCNGHRKSCQGFGWKFVD